MPKLNEPTKKWIAALVSGKFRQAKGYLAGRTSNSYCCLGVLCEVAVENGVPIKIGQDSMGRKTYDGSASNLPKSVREWAGLKSHCGTFEWPEGTHPTTKRATAALTNLNDSARWTFRQIADLIASQPEGLFKDGNF